MLQNQEAARIEGTGTVDMFHTMYSDYHCQFGTLNDAKEELPKSILTLGRRPSMIRTWRLFGFARTEM